MDKAQQWLLQEKYAGVEGFAFHADCTRLQAGEPLAYIIGHVPFLHCIIYLDSRPLIPRPETEFWVNHLITTINRSTRSELRVLDMCAGSGCIGVAIANSLPQARVDFAEIDECHHHTITKNMAANTTHPVAGSINDTSVIYGGDLFTAIPEDARYDIIVSNPPYIDPVLDRTDPSVTEHEPPVALYGGAAGLEYLRQIIVAAPHYLRPSGTVWLEHEPEQTTALHTQGAAHGFLVTTHSDQYEIKRYTQLVLQ